MAIKPVKGEHIIIVVDELGNEIKKIIKII
jgi:hypothetical protein